MNSFAQGTAAALFLGLAAAGTANAAEIFVSGDITTDQTWTADNTYNLQGQVYVLPGATLTIEPGTVVASDPGGSLAITNGADIIADGTVDQPIIFTSKADVATWTGGDPRTGTWRQTATEWGNLTIMGDAYIGACTAGNSPAPSASNVAPMEGLTFGGSRDEYGGGNDDDDSGVLNFVSFRYGGKVVALTKELNGLSLGGIGRGTDISHVEIMNNVDDGIEIWGGTVEIDHFAIWNIGDDSLDIDQGWRGKAQFGLIVQGASLDASQGSGYGDNAIEHDGAETSDYQPVTTGAIANVTVIGQPSGDGGTAWRDNCRMQYFNCLWMDLGEQLVRPDNVDGDPCGTGYGFNGTLSFADTWTTSAAVTSPVNPFGSPAAIADAYQNQDPAGTLAEIRNSLFYNNTASNAYDEAIARGVLGAGATPANGNSVTTTQPIKDIQRAAPTLINGNLVFQQVIGLDPRAAGDAVTAPRVPISLFADPGRHAGAFDDCYNWCLGWTAADAFGFFIESEEVIVSGDIAVDTTWTSDKRYNLDGQVYLLPGATLTIEPGTIIASNEGGALAVTNGADIIANGTQEKPIIWTSKRDYYTWVGGKAGDPADWRFSNNEWGNLTIMGDAYIGACTAGNSPAPSASNVAPMEGLTFGGSRDEYGGGNDDDDSGSLRYNSFRYGGKVVALTKELNGLSLGGIGRGTDVSYIEIMNNVDDGIEIWGGTVDIDHFTIWNIGDDSLDIDQGWRGTAQFGLIVQGASSNASQGSGYGDNAIEHDGAETSDYQPVTTGAIANVTVIGQPSGDGGTAWRDNCRMQYFNCIWMDLGEKLVRPDNVDGDPCGTGYGFNGTLSFADTWTTSAAVTSPVNPFGSPAAIADAYQSQDPSGNLAQIVNSVFYNNTNASAYTDAIAVGVLGAGGAPANGNIVANASPIRSITRDTPILVNGNLVFSQVIGLDPRAQNDAAVAPNPPGSLFAPAPYEGGFNTTDNWLCNWTAADQYGFVELPAEKVVYNDGTTAPVLDTNGMPTIGNVTFGYTLDVTAAPCSINPASFFGYGIFVTAGGPQVFPSLVDGGCNGVLATTYLAVFPSFAPILTFTGSFVGSTTIPLPLPPNRTLCGARITAQGAVIDVFTSQGYITDGVELVVGD